MKKNIRKSRRNKSSLLKKIQKTSKQIIPVADKSLQHVGNTAKNVAVKTAPMIEKGVSAVYGTLATGFDLGVKGSKNIIKNVSKMTQNKNSKKRRAKKTRKHK
jgi:hypothetical protein